LLKWRNFEMGRDRRNVILAGAVALVMIGMTGMSFAAIPLYRLFCAVTGFGGTPDISGASAPGNGGQSIRVRFNADTNPGLPWDFAPEQTEVVSKLGDEEVAFYRAVNQSNRAVTGMALYNVTPEKVGKYFHKTACFCFNKQTLASHQTMEFPVSFWVDPAIRSDPNTADVKVITLSYTFFRSLEDAEKAGALAKAGPHVGPMSAADLASKQEAN
jgi:cytochrome c oxidase assembly protein subunit 11